MNSLYKKYGNQVEFFLIYIREAHPTDGWQVSKNKRDGVLFTQPKTLNQRVQIAKTMCLKLNISIPPLIDRLDDRVNKSYSAWPDRLYLVGKDGKIAFKGGRGPRGFRPDELAEAIKKEIAKEKE